MEATPDEEFVWPSFNILEISFYHFSKWSKDGSCYKLWTTLLEINKASLDMSSTELDGSHTSAKRGGLVVDYQGRKKAKTTNMLFLTDKQGLPLACSNPVVGNHNDLFEVEKNVSKIVTTLSDAQISCDGIFMNADAGINGRNLRALCEKYGIIPNFDIQKRNAKTPDQNDYYFDSQLYKERFAIERT